MLMTSYMLAGEMCDVRDYEAFAKAYLPINVKSPFNDIFHDPDVLTDRERLVFKDIYLTNPGEFYSLARSGAVTADGDTRLFPPKAHWDLRRFHITLPTWKDLLEKTANNTKLKVTRANTIKKKNHKLGDEILFAGLSSMIPLAATSPQVPLELRRIGYRAHNSKIWNTLMMTVRHLARKLNP